MRLTLPLFIAMLLAALLSVPHMAWANAVAIPDDWVECGGTGTNFNTSPSSQNRLRQDGLICFAADDSWTAGELSPFFIETNRASCNLVMDQLAASGTANLTINACPTGNSTRNATTCPQVVKTFSSDDSVNITRGTYLIVNTVAPTAGDEMIFSCRGYE